MIIWPAIDLKDGNCVRLQKGDFSTAHKVAEDALETAKAFEAKGAKYLHMVDLDGAKDAARKNSAVVLDVVRNTSLKVEIGGGIRSMEAVDYYLSQGVYRVILGSAAVQNPAFVKEAVAKYAERIVVGIDARDGRVACDGWLDVGEAHYLDLAREMEKIGVKSIIFTDISRDGMLSGPNLEQLAALQDAVSCAIVASGGIRDIEDIRALIKQGLSGAICGKSLYQGTLSVEDAVQAAGPQA